MIVVIADGTPIQSLKVDRECISLKELRNQINQNPHIPFQLTRSLLFLKDGKTLDTPKQEEMKLCDYLKNDEFEVYLNSQLNTVQILINNKQKQNLQVPLAFTLTSLRNFAPSIFALHLSFFKKDKVIRHIDESKIRISDIITNNTISINEAKGEKEVWQEEGHGEKQDIVQKTKKETKKRAAKKKGAQIEDFKVLVDKQKECPMKMDIQQNLHKLRESCPQIKDQMSFTWKNGPIADDDEEAILIADIIDEAPKSAFTLINKKDASKPSVRDTVCVAWIAEKNKDSVVEKQKKNEKQEIKGSSSLEQFLNIDAITCNSIPKGVHLDPDGNPADSAYDLGRDGMFTGYKILIGTFYTGEDILNSLKNKTACLALQSKGFIVDIVTTELEFASKVPNYDQIWVISNSVSKNQDKYIQAVKKHVAQKKGLLIWADNSPYFKHANEILEALLEPKEQIELFGNDHGTKMLERTTESTPKIKTFIQHQITTGIFRMNEGITICYPVNKKSRQAKQLGDLQVIGVGSAGRPSYVALEGDDSRGRIIIDCGCTKLFPSYWNGNWRYVRNCAVWLLWLEYMLGK